MTNTSQYSVPAWMTFTLRAAGVYNLVWGAVIIMFPLALFQWAGMEPPRYPQIWQCVGMIVGVYGIGYWVAARDPFRHWPIVLVGFLGKVLGPIGFLQAALTGALPWAWGATIVTNDLIWWIPFAMMLYGAFRENTDTSEGTPAARLNTLVERERSHRYATLSELSRRGPVLLVFLRHSGCTFCREALDDLQEQRDQIEQGGVTLAIVHMGKPMDGTLLAEKYKLHGVHRFSDPDCRLYRAFGLERGKWGQLFSGKVIKRGLAAIVRGHGIGTLVGDGFRMPGAFTLVDGKVLESHRCESAADRPDYVGMASRAANGWAGRGQSTAQRATIPA